MSLLAVEEIHTYYGEAHILQGVSLTVGEGEVIGQVVRTRDGVQPVYVSAGHRIDLDSAVRWTLVSCQGYRIPEPTRQAHLHVNELRRQDNG